MKTSVRALLIAVNLCSTLKAETTPQVKQVLEIFGDQPSPTAVQAKACVDALEKVTGEAEVQRFIATLKELYRAEAIVGPRAAGMSTKLKKLKSDYERDYRRALGYRQNPIRRVDGGVDVQGTNITIENITRSNAKIALDFQELRRSFGPILEPLVKQLTAANAQLQTYVESGETEMLVALGTAVFAIQERNGVTLNFEPAVSATWLRLRRLPPAKLAVAMSKAKEELKEWIAKNLLAKGFTATGMHLISGALESENPLFNLIGGGFIATQALEAEKQTELKMQALLEILLFDPDPNSAAKKVSAKALQHFITGTDPSAPLLDRFSDEAIGSFLGKIDPRLAVGKSIVDRISPLLR